MSATDEQPPQFAEALEESPEAATKELETAQPNDSLTAVEPVLLEVSKLKLEVERLSNEVEEAKELHETRLRYIPRLYGLVVGWLVVVIGFVALTAFGLAHLSDAVLIAFITSTTASVLGLFFLVARWLFPEVQSKKKKP